jgi:putative FmdB family regulatory protein
MPTYDYVCDACDHKFELFQSINAPVKKKCPACGRLKLRRLFGTGAAIMFKGSGFYETDYRSDSYKKGAQAEKKSADGGSSGGDAGGGAKDSAAKSESPGKSDSAGKSESSGKSESGKSETKSSSDAGDKKKKTSD